MDYIVFDCQSLNTKFAEDGQSTYDIYDTYMTQNCITVVTHDCLSFLFDEVLTSSSICCCEHLLYYRVNK